MINREALLKSYVSNGEYDRLLQNATIFSDISLPVWHLEITSKRLCELSDFDLIRCIRQDIFIDLAIFEMIERINEHGSPFYAGIDSMELMEKLSSVRVDRLSLYQDKLNKIIEKIEQNHLIDVADIWMYDEQKETYQGYMNIIKNKIR